jgi:molecular chaperone GrpE
MTKEKKKEDIKEETPKTYTQADIDAYQTALDDAQAVAEQYLEDLQRERASFANYKRRVDQDNQLTAEIQLGKSINLFLPVVDDLERALKNQPEDMASKAWAEGIELILQKLRTAMAKLDVEVIDIKPGDDFDPTDQEALTHEESETYKDGQVIEVIQTGYKLKDRIIRPAAVRVAK